MEPVKRLKELAGAENRALVLHLACYPARDHSMPAYYKARELLRNRLLDVMPGQVAEALAPLLDSDDDALARAAETLLRTRIRCSDARCVDDAIGALVQRSTYEKTPLPRGLIRFVLRSFPDGALVTSGRHAGWCELKKARSPEAHQRMVRE